MISPRRPSPTPARWKVEATDSASGASAGWRRSLWLTVWLLIAGCFVGSALWRSFNAELPAAPTSATDRFRAIESIRVGQRVVANNPKIDSPAETEVDSGTWRLIRLRAETLGPDGALDQINVETLQSERWIKAHQARVGAIVPLPLGGRKGISPIKGR